MRCSTNNLMKKKSPKQQKAVRVMRVSYTLDYGQDVMELVRWPG